MMTLGWAQSSVEAEQIISKLTLENQTVMDPMMGSGTTGNAALQLKCKFIGIEIDTRRFEIAKSNLSSFI
jgi:DNA modification methylase